MYQGAGSWNPGAWNGAGAWSGAGAAAQSPIHPGLPAAPKPGVTKPGQRNIELLESQFTEKANKLYENLLNMNVTNVKMSQEFDQLLHHRSSLLTAYGVPQVTPVSKSNQMAAAGPEHMMKALMTMMGGAGGGCGGDWGAYGGGQDMDYKSKLLHHVSKKVKRSLTKSDVTYVVSPDESGKKFTATVSIPSALSQEYSSPDVADSKKKAEHAAAKVALVAEFPEALVADEAAVWWGAGGVGAGGTKRKASALDAPGQQGNQDPKSRLSRSGQLLLGRTLTKEDIIYETMTIGEPPSAQFQASVALPAYDPDAKHVGEVSGSIREAQKRAAEVALAAYAEAISVAEERHKEKKAKQSRENLEKFKAKKAEDKPPKLSE